MSRVTTVLRPALQPSLSLPVALPPVVRATLDLGALSLVSALSLSTGASVLCRHIPVGEPIPSPVPKGLFSPHGSHPHQLSSLSPESPRRWSLPLMYSQPSCLGQHLPQNSPMGTFWNCTVHHSGRPPRMVPEPSKHGQCVLNF